MCVWSHKSRILYTVHLTLAYGEIRSLADLEIAPISPILRSYCSNQQTCFCSQAERQCRITGDGEDSNYITEVPSNICWKKSLIQECFPVKGIPLDSGGVISYLMIWMSHNWRWCEFYMRCSDVDVSLHIRRFIIFLFFPVPCRLVQGSWMKQNIVMPSEYYRSNNRNPTKTQG